MAGTVYNVQGVYTALCRTVGGGGLGNRPSCHCARLEAYIGPIAEQDTLV